MPCTKPFIEYARNNLYERSFFEEEMPNLLAQQGNKEESTAVFTAVKDFFLKNPPLQMNEGQLEDSIIKPLFALLDWPNLPKENKTVQGKTFEPDWLLFTTPKAKADYLAIQQDMRKDNMEGIATFAEVKAADKTLDTKKADRKENPYLQLLEYLTLARMPFGILTNGVEWWLLDNKEISAEKRYIAVNLQRILEDDNKDAFHIFYTMFHRTSFVPEEQKATLFEEINKRDQNIRKASEENLRRVIYGENGGHSLFESIGQAIFKASGSKGDAQSLKQVYENSLYFVFRLLFIAYFEDKHWETLQNHSSYPSLSLRNLYETLPSEAPNAYTGWDNLQNLFTTLDKGNKNRAIPLLNGGLFDNTKAPLLDLPMVMDNHTLGEIFHALFLFDSTEKTMRRDFKALSVTHLGSMYEGLLEFSFRVAEKPLKYLAYTFQKSKSEKEEIEGFFDTYDEAALRKNPKVSITKDRPFPAGTLYLVSSQNSRKASASYYTPSSLSFPLVKRAIDHALAALPAEKSVLDLRILDNACGSGHILIESLKYLTQCALDRIQDDAKLRSTLQEENSRLQEVLQSLGVWEKMQPDENTVLKRVLLKKVIFGVDIQPFAIELTHLSLWIETFIFGTPLSFIEHHVKAGNALMGAEISQFRAEAGLAKGLQGNLLYLTVQDEFSKLLPVYMQLSTIQDTTAEDIEKSKKLFATEIRPALSTMNTLLDVLNYKNVLRAEGKKKEAQAVMVNGMAEKLAKEDVPELLATLQTYRETYGFFNWEIEFPEAFAGAEKGFHIVVGNPPWDKTKFEDPLFFSHYRSNYRNLSNTEKATVKSDLLQNPEILVRYNQQQAYTLATNEYYKLFYPLNEGAGDGNLFRFFVERNLRLLTKGGTLNYVLPTALLTEDGSATLRKHILEKYHITAFDGFENRKRIFPEVDSRYKFGLLQIENKAPQNRPMFTRFMQTDPAVLKTDAGVFAYTMQDLLATSPKHFAFMEVAYGRADLDLLTRCYQKFPPLNPEWMDFRRELDATNDKCIFHEQYKAGFLPLYKGASIWQYNSLFTEPEYWLDQAEFDAYLLNKEISRLVEDVYPALNPEKSVAKEKTVLKAVGLQQRKELGQFVVPDRCFFRLGFRDIARDTDERTLICSLLPQNIGAQNKLIISIPKYYFFDEPSRNIACKKIPIFRLLFIQSLFNSLLVDWVLRFSISITVNKTYLMRQPMPQPTDEELETNPIYREMVYNSLKLSLHYNKEGFQELQKQFCVQDADIPKTDKQVDALKIRNDILVAKLYGISGAEMGHILQSFPVLKNKKPGYVASLLEEAKKL